MVVESASESSFVQDGDPWLNEVEVGGDDFFEELWRW